MVAAANELKDGNATIGEPTFTFPSRDGVTSCVPASTTSGFLSSSRVSLPEGSRMIFAPLGLTLMMLPSLSVTGLWSEPSIVPSGAREYRECVSGVREIARPSGPFTTVPSGPRTSPVIQTSNLKLPHLPYII